MRVCFSGDERRVAYVLNAAFDLDDGAIVLDPTSTACVGVYDEIGEPEWLVPRDAEQAQRMGRNLVEKYADDIRDDIRRQIDERREYCKELWSDAKAGR